MSVSKSVKQPKLKNSTSKTATGRKSSAKSEVTRWGTEKDWRVAGKGKAKSLEALRNRPRNGR